MKNDLAVFEQQQNNRIKILLENYNKDIESLNNDFHYYENIFKICYFKNSYTDQKKLDFFKNQLNRKYLIKFIDMVVDISEQRGTPINKEIITRKEIHETENNFRFPDITADFLKEKFNAFLTTFFENKKKSLKNIVLYLKRECYKSQKYYKIEKIMRVNGSFCQECTINKKLNIGTHAKEFFKNFVNNLKDFDKEINSNEFEILNELKIDDYNVLTRHLYENKFFQIEFFKKGSLKIIFKDEKYVNFLNNRISEVLGVTLFNENK